MSDLLKINVNDRTEKKNGLTYLSWAWAWAEVLKIDPQAKIIMCSAMGQVDKVKAAVMAGAKSFLVKPLQPERVLATVKQFLG